MDTGVHLAAALSLPELQPLPNLEDAVVVGRPVNYRHPQGVRGSCGTLFPPVPTFDRGARPLPTREPVF